LNPEYAEAHTELGTSLKAQGKYEEAIASYRRAVELKPAYAEAHSNLGVALQKQGKLDEAVDCYRKAAELKPTLTEAHCNLGLVLQEQGDLDGADEAYRRALQLQPDLAEARFCQSTLLLLRGDFERGLPGFEWRWKTGRLPARDFGQPAWAGQPLSGKRILLHGEQGLGDTLQFIRYVPLVRLLGATVLLECPRPLTKLLQGLPGLERLIAQGDELPTFDFHLPLLSLPLVFKTTLETVPANVPYLSANVMLVAQWRQKLESLRGLRIGINWHGREGALESRRRDIPLECFAALARIPSVRLISLQKGAGRTELASSSIPIFDPGEEVDTSHGAFVDTAAIMTNLDLVITSDTALPHLAGALGIPVWLALPFVPEWRWLLDRSDSPWYSTMQLFRQNRAGDWARVFEEIRTALIAIVLSK
jgi:tetratricopeptide (TPR) repeat protein